MGMFDATVDFLSVVPQFGVLRERLRLLIREENTLQMAVLSNIFSLLSNEVRL